MELKPCPFCGSEDLECTEACGENWVKCWDCGAMSGLREKEIDCGEAWNRRAGEKEL